MKKTAVAIAALLASPLAFSQRSADTSFTIGIDFGEVELANYAEYCKQAQDYLEGVTLKRFDAQQNTTDIMPVSANGPCADIQYTYRLRAALRVNEWLTAKGSYMTADSFESSHNITLDVSGAGSPNVANFRRYLGGLASYETEFSLFQFALQGEREMSPGLFVAGSAGLRSYDLKTSFTHAYHEAEIPDPADDPLVRNPEDINLEANRELLDEHMPSFTKQRTGSGSVLLLGAAVEREANRNLTAGVQADLGYDMETEETAVEYAFWADWTVIENASLRIGYEQFAAGPEEMSQLYLGAGYSLEF